MELLTVLLIAISISCDAFSLALAYGLLDVNKTKIFISFLVGTFHFIMPLIGMFIGNVFINKMPINLKYLIAIIFTFIFIEMVKSINENKEQYCLTLRNILLFAFFVSIDSFSIGIGLNYITHEPLKACVIFALFSGVFTYIGFSLGKYISIKLEKISKILGITLIAFLIVYFLCK